MAISDIVDDLSVKSARKIEVAHEDGTRIESILAITWPASQGERVIVVTIAPVIVSAVTRIVAPSRIVKHGRLRRAARSDLDVARGQNGDNRARFRVGGGCPPPSNTQ